MLNEFRESSFDWDLAVLELYYSENRPPVPSNVANAPGDYESAIAQTPRGKKPVIISNDFDAKTIFHFAAQYDAIFVDKWRSAVIYRTNWHYIAGTGNEPWQGNAAHLAKVLLGMEQLRPETTRQH